MGAPPGKLYFRSAPSSARKLTVWGFLCVYGTLSVIAVGALHGSAPPYFDLVGAVILAAFVGRGVIRAARISVTANENEVWIANQFRSYRLSWTEIEQIGASNLPAPFGSKRPAISFRTKAGRTIKAQALSTKRAEREATMADLRYVVPTEVVVEVGKK